MRYASRNTSDEDMEIITEDGGVATVHWNGHHFITTYFHRKASKFTFDDTMFEELNGHYVSDKDWFGTDKLRNYMALDAARWLCFTSDRLDRVDFDELVNKYNNQTT
jgi:hypothetical protein